MRRGRDNRPRSRAHGAPLPGFHGPLPRIVRRHESPAELHESQNRELLLGRDRAFGISRLKIKRSAALNEENAFRRLVATCRVPVSSTGLHQIRTRPELKLWLTFRTLNVGAGHDDELHIVSVGMHRSGESWRQPKDCPKGSAAMVAP